MTSKPITTELRDAFVSVHAGTETSAAWLTFDGETFYNLCDAIDSIHANLERENTSLKAELDRLMGDQECERPTPTDGITDELREWAARELAGWKMARERFDALTAIADRIDAEHKKAVRELNDYASDSVLLPRDADGEVIHIGDVMEWPEDGETFEVIGIGDGWTLFYVIEDGVAEWTRAEDKRHHQPDTWERIIADARTCTGSAGNYTSVPSMRWTNEVDVLVARCRALAGDAS